MISQNKGCGSYCETGFIIPVIFLLTVPGGVCFVDHFFVICVFLMSKSSSLVVTCWERFLVCDVFLCFCHFPIGYPRSGMLINFIHS